MSLQIVNRPVTIRRGKLTVPAGDPEQAAPTSGQTITLYDQTLDSTNAPGNQKVLPPWSRIRLTLFSSHDSGANGVVYAESQDGTNFDTLSTFTYLNANGSSTYDFLYRGGHPKITYTNSANTLTSWRYTLEGIIGDRNPGV